MSAVRLSVDVSGLSGFEKNLLEHHACSALLEMKCIYEGDSVEIVYNTGGMKTLDQVLAGSLADPAAVLTVCSDFLQAVRICEDYLLTERDLSFDDRSIYFSGDLVGVRFKYYPGCGDNVSVREKLAAIADEAMEYHGDREGMVELMSVYKKRLYSIGECDSRDLVFITDQCAKAYQGKQSVREERTEPFTAAEEKKEEEPADSLRQKMENGILQKVKAWIDDLVS